MSFSKILSFFLVLVSPFAKANELPVVSFVLSPHLNETAGITYSRILEILNKQRYVTYGEPIAIEINKSLGTVDIFDFSDLIIRVPLEEALLQPNRTEPTR